MYETYKILNSSKSEKPELGNLKLLYILSVFLYLVDYLMPQYFGFHIKFDFTCTRIADVLFVCYFVLNKTLLTHGIKITLKNKAIVPCCMYIFVALYTMVFRADVNAFFLVFLELFTFYILIYIIRYVLGVKKAIVWGIRCAYFFAVEGLVEYVYGKSIYHMLLSTVPNNVINCYRSGRYRIMGPCGHPLAYGLLLVILIAIATIDIEKDEIYVFKRPFLLILLMLNVFLTGSRSTLGVMFVEVTLLFLFSSRISKKKSLFILVIFIVGLSLFLLAFHNTGIGQYILMQLASVLDHVLGTEYAAMFGADVTTLKNSEEYRKLLPKIFLLDWLNPLLGRGVKRGFGAEIDGAYIQSIDNYYVAQYIKYAYPGLISYILFILANAISMIYNSIKYRSGVLVACMVAFGCYFYNLWWLDALQTPKYLYIILAIFWAFTLLIEDYFKEIQGKGNA